MVLGEGISSFLESTKDKLAGDLSWDEERVKALSSITGKGEASVKSALRTLLDEKEGDPTLRKTLLQAVNTDPDFAEAREAATRGACSAGRCKTESGGGKVRPSSRLFEGEESVSFSLVEGKVYYSSSSLSSAREARSELCEEGNASLCDLSTPLSSTTLDPGSVPVSSSYRVRFPEGEFLVMNEVAVRKGGKETCPSALCSRNASSCPAPLCRIEEGECVPRN